MQYQLFFIPFYFIYTLSTHIDRNNSDVIITYTGHNEADRALNNKINKELIPNQVTEVPQTQNIMTVPGEVVFIPDDKEVMRNEDYRDVKVHDLIENTNIHNVMKAERKAEKPAEDIIFISGKNNENHEPSVDKPTENQSSKPTSKKIKLDCRNLDCNNTLASICGMKEEDKKIRYRMFLNECFFRKVNCAFNYASNRYKMVPIERCKNIGGRVMPKPYVQIPSKAKKEDTRRSFSSRRTLNMGVDGAFCGHSCPDHCTEDYEPQCAISASGDRRVFVNHCVLDYNSCLYGAVWQRRPLSECVGGKKADVRQNRGFIGWLQRVGIVDKRGRLVLTD